MLIVTIYKRFRNRIRVKNAIKHADKMHRLTKKQYYVLQIFGKIRVYDRARINLLVAQGVLKKNMRNAYNLQKVAIYYTK